MTGRIIGPSDAERRRIQMHFCWMNSLPGVLPSAAAAFGHIPNKVNKRGYDHMPHMLGDPDEHFADTPHMLGDPETVFAHL